MCLKRRRRYPSKRHQWVQTVAQDEPRLASESMALPLPQGQGLQNGVLPSPPSPVPGSVAHDKNSLEGPTRSCSGSRWITDGLRQRERRYYASAEILH
ncbi:unnamed protein product [Lota lota]